MIEDLMSWGFWRTSARLAWRDLRGSWLRSAFIVGAIGISIASVTGVYGSAAYARKWLGRDSRVWLAGDVAVDTTEPIGRSSMAALDAKRGEGIEWTLITWVLTMAASDQAPDPIFISVKAIDPAVYPFYGATFGKVLRADTVVVSHQVLEELQIRPGDQIRIGGRPFIIAGEIAAEPERTSGALSWGPRCILSRSAFERLGAAGLNTRTNRILLRLPRAEMAKSAQQWLQTLIPEGRVFDYRDAAAPEVKRIELAISFVSVVAFLSLALGAIGVATAVRLNLDQRTGTLAIMRITGARTSQMASLFLIETAAMMAGGLALGIPLGWGITISLLSLSGKYLTFSEPVSWDATAIAESAVATAAMMVPLLFGPADALHRLRPLAFLRGENAATGKSSRALLGAFALAACAAALAIAYRLIESWKPALFIVAALALSGAVAWVLGLVVLGCLRRVRLPVIRHAVIKHAGIGLYRSPSRSLILIACLALGAMTISATFESSDAVTRSVSAALPYPNANLLIADFEDSHREEVRAMLDRQPGVERVDMLAETWLRVARVNGVPVEDSRYLARCATGSTSGVVMADDLASRLGAGAGSVLEFETREGTLKATVTAIHHPRPEERFWFTFVVDCRGLPEASLFQAAAIRIAPGQVDAVRRAINKQYPTLAAIPTEEIESMIRGVTHDAMTILRMVTWIVGLGGLLILIAIVAASRAERSREIAILAALGATRKTIFKIHSLEFASLGAIAGAIGGILGWGFSTVILSVLFHRVEAAVSWRALAAAMLILPVLTMAAGWLPSYRLLKTKPMDVLRKERI